MIVIGESEETWTGLHSHPPYLEKRKCVSTSLMWIFGILHAPRHKTPSLITLDRRCRRSWCILHAPRHKTPSLIMLDHQRTKRCSSMCQSEQEWLLTIGTCSVPGFGENKLTWRKVVYCWRKEIKSSTRLMSSICCPHCCPQVWSRDVVQPPIFWTVSLKRK